VESVTLMPVEIAPERAELANLAGQSGSTQIGESGHSLSKHAVSAAG
jgi:hypothetical protein